MLLIKWNERQFNTFNNILQVNPSRLAYTHIRFPVFLTPCLYQIFCFYYSSHSCTIFCFCLILRWIYLCIAHFYTFYLFMHCNQIYWSYIITLHSFIHHVLHLHFLLMRCIFTYFSCIAMSHLFVNHVLHTLIVHALNLYLFIIHAFYLFSVFISAIYVIAWSLFNLFFSLTYIKF